MKARIKFTKCGSMRFIGHLDVMRYFQKAFRRAGIQVSYSQGFSPHQLMSFASPLGIGLSSDAEYLDLTLDACDVEERMLEKINAQMNEEIRVCGFYLLQEDAKPAMAILAACDYLVMLKQGYSSFLLPESFKKSGTYQSLSELLQAFLAQEKIEILKKTKRSEKLVDIRENIYDLSEDTDSIQAEGYWPLLRMQLTAGSIVNIKPELVLQALADFAGAAYEPAAYQIHRQEMYGDADGKKGEVHTPHSAIPCRLVPLSAFERR